MGGGINCKICRNKKYEDLTEMKFNKVPNEDELNIITYNESLIKESNNKLKNNIKDKNNETSEKKLIKGKINNETKEIKKKKKNEYESMTSVFDAKIEIIEDQNLNILKGNNLKIKNEKSINGKKINIDSKNISPIFANNNNENNSMISKLNNPFYEDHSQLENNFIRNILNNEIFNINLGFNNENTLNYEEKILFNEAKKNLANFNPIDKKDIKLLEKKLKKIPLGNLIPENKNFEEIIKNEEGIIFHGELKKLINYEYYNKKPKMYSSKFCLITSKYFKYYKSKEQFLRDLNPISIISLSHISRINFCKIPYNNKFLFHLIIVNKFAFFKNEKNILIDNLMQSSFSDVNECLLIFNSDNEDSLLKWYFLLNYLIDKKKE